MERLDELIDTFRADHPDLDADILRDFAQHVQRVLRDEIREQVRVDQAPVKVSMQLNGNTFSAAGPRAMVEDLLARWDTALDLRHRNITPGFNRLQLTGRGFRTE